MKGGGGGEQVPRRRKHKCRITVRKPRPTGLIVRTKHPWLYGQATYSHGHAISSENWPCEDEPDQRSTLTAATAKDDWMEQVMRQHDAAAGSLHDDRKPVSIMIAGDSMTHGEEGDFTWRYRLWAWLRATAGRPVNFVGPYRGTKGPAVATGPQPPAVQGEESPAHALTGPIGKYAVETGPIWPTEDAHFSSWGYQAAQAKDAIQEMVQIYQPDYLLIALGFNDMGWLVSDAKGTLRSLEGLIANARGGRPDINIVAATVPHRLFLREDLVENTEEYNARIKLMIGRLSTNASPIKLADFAKHYSCDRDYCPAGYDGLHPNALGEWQIAQAFSEALQAFGLRHATATLDIPSHVTEPQLDLVTDLHAHGSPAGIKVTWGHVFGARSYDVRFRRKLSDHAQVWSQTAVLSARFDTTNIDAGESWEYQVRPSRGNAHKGTWSGTVMAVSRRCTPPAPEDVVVTPSPSGAMVTWTAVQKWDIDRYEVVTWDRDTPGAFIGGWSTRGSEIELNGLNAGHRYNVWLGSWALVEGELVAGNRSGAAPFTPGSAEPYPPTLMLADRNAQRITLAWTSSTTAAAYLVYRRAAGGEDKTFVSEGEYIFDATATAIVGSGAAEYYVVAVNGSLESAPSNIVRVEPTPVGFGAGPLSDGVCHTT